MADLDTLSIELQASDRKASQALEGLEKSLSSIASYLGKMTIGDTLAESLERVAGAIDDISISTRNIDAGSMKEFASALKSVSSATSSLTRMSSEMAKTSGMAKTVSAEAKRTAKELASSWGIKGKEATAELSKAVNELYDSLGSGRGVSDARSNLESVIQKYAQIETQVDETAKAVREYISASNIKMPKNLKGEWGDDFNRKRGALGINNTSGAGIGLDQIGPEINGLYGDILNLNSSVEDMASQLVDYFERAGDGVLSFKEAEQQGLGVSEQLAHELDSLTGEVQEADQSFSGSNITDFVTQMRQAGESILVTSEQMDSLTNKDLSSLFTTDIDSIFTGARELDDVLAEMNAALNTSITDIRGFQSAFENAAGALPQYSTNAQTAISSQERLAEATRHTAEAVSATSVDGNPLGQIADSLRSLEGISIPNLSSLSSIAAGVRGFGYDAAAQAVQNIPLIADGLRALSGITLPDLVDVAGFAAGLQKLGGKKILDAAYALPFIADGLKRLEGINITLGGVGELANTISAFGKSTAVKAADNIPRLADAFKHLIETLRSAGTVNRNVIDLANAMGNLASNGTRVGAVVGGTAGRLHNYGSAAKSASKHSFSLAAAIGKIYATYWLLFRAFGKLKEAIDISSALTEVQNVVDQTFGGMSSRLEDVADTSIKTLGMSELELKKIASRYQAMGVAMGMQSSAVAQSSEFLRENSKMYGHTATAMADMSIELTKLTADMASFYNVDNYSDVAKDLEAIFTGMTRPLRKYGLDLTEATLKEWAMKNGLDANIRTMTQAEKTLLRYQYVLANTAAAQGDFARTSQTWANQIRILKQQFQQLGAIIGTGLINFLKPGLQRLNRALNAMISMVQKALNALGKIFGWQMEIAPVGVVMEDSMDGYADSADDVADALGGAAKQAKKLKDYTFGLDELNIFRPDDDDGGGGKGKGAGYLVGGGGAGGANTSGGGVSWKKYESDIDNLWELGRRIADSLADLLEGIDWDKIYRKAERFGTGLADFLNGLITPRLFYDLGMTIANSLNTALHFLDSFGERFDWKKFGRSIAAGINGFFENFDFPLFAKTINVWAHGLLDALIAALDNTDWNLIGDRIGRFLADIDFIGIGKKIGIAIWKAINAGFALFEGMFEAAPLEAALLGMLGIVKLLKTASFVKFAQDIAAATKAMANFAGAVAGSKTAMAALYASNAKLLPLARGLNSAFGLLGASFQTFAFAMRTGTGLIGSLAAGFETLWLGIKAAVAGLSTFAQTALIVASVAVEFFAVKDAIYDIATGTGNLAVNIAELAAAVGIAGIALSAVFGPVGLLVTGLVAGTAALAGLSKAINQEIDTSAWNSVGQALSAPGGVPIEDLANKYTESFGRIESEFNRVAEASNGLEEVRTNVENTSAKIDTIAFAMEHGAIVTDSKITEIKSLFNSLYEDSKAIFEQEKTIIYEGIAGALGRAAEDAGISVESIILSLNRIEGGYNEAVTSIENEIARLEEAHNRGEISDEEFANGIIENGQKLTGLVGSNDAYSESLGRVSDAVASASVDFSKLIDQSGQLNTDVLASQITQVSTAYEDASAAVSAASESMQGAFDKVAGYGDTLGLTEDSALLKKVADLEKSGAETAKQELESSITDYGNAIQTGLLEKIPSVVDQALADYENLSWWAKWNTSEAEYVQKALSDYQSEVIGPAAEELSAMYEQLGVDGAVFATEAGSTIIGSLFGADVDYSAYSVEAQATLRGNVEEIVSGALEGIGQFTEDYGKGTIDGYNTGIENNQDSSKTYIDGWQNAIDGYIHDGVMKFGSPSITAMGYGADTVLGYNQGIEKNVSTSRSVIATWMNEISAAMTEGMANIATVASQSMLVENWGQMFSAIPTALRTVFVEVSAAWNESATTWMSNDVTPFFTVERWMQASSGMRDGISQSWMDFVVQWQQLLTSWWSADVIPWFAVERWTLLGSNMRTGVYEGFKGIVADIGRIMNALIDVFNQALRNIANNANTTINSVNNALRSQGLATINQIQYSTIPHISIPSFRAGGFPEDGLFYANHNELIGRFSNGRTVVANNDQITEGIENAAYRGFLRATTEDSREISLLEELITAVREGNSITVDGRELVAAYDDRKTRNGYQFATYSI